MSLAKNILYIGNFLSGRGLTRKPCEELVPRLVARDWSLILTSSVKNRIARFLNMCWVTFSNRNSYDLAIIDVFSGPSFFWAEWTTWLLTKVEKPIILVLHGGSLPVFAARQPKRMERLLSRADRVLSPSTYLQTTLSQYEKKIELLPNGIEIKHYPYSVRSQAKPNIVWLRAFYEDYNPALAIDVIVRLVKILPSAKLTMIGPDRNGYLGQIKDRAFSLGVGDFIDFPGGVTKSDVPIWLNKGDIFINTTNVDNTPVSVIEAMACGLCVVSTNVGGLPFLLEDGVDALLVPPNDPEAMALAVIRILNEPGLAEKLSHNARRKAENFDWSVILPQWEAIFNDLVEKRR